MVGLTELRVWHAVECRLVLIPCLDHLREHEMMIEGSQSLFLSLFCAFLALECKSNNILADKWLERLLFVSKIIFS